MLGLEVCVLCHYLSTYCFVFILFYFVITFDYFIIYLGYEQQATADLMNVLNRRITQKVVTSF